MCFSSRIVCCPSFYGLERPRGRGTLRIHRQDRQGPNSDLMMRSGIALRGLILGLALAGASPAGQASANPALLFDLGTGKVVMHEDAFKPWYPASLTKLMTAYVTFRAVEAGELAFDSPIEVSKHAAA